MAVGTKKWSAETKSDLITTFFLGWPSKKVFQHKIPGIKKSSTKIEKIVGTKCVGTKLLRRIDSIKITIKLKQTTNFSPFH